MLRASGVSRSVPKPDPGVTKLFTDPAHASLYAAFRPTYPDALYEAIFKYMGPDVPRTRAVDVATGSGQAAVPIAKAFDRVDGVDVSEAQISGAVAPADNICFSVGTAEDMSPIPDKSASLVTVAQALHWFDLEKFYAEANRVLTPGGTLAIWGYATNTLHHDGLDATLDKFYNGLLGPYWSDRRTLVDAELRGLEPTKYFTDGVRTSIPMSKTMPLQGYVNYLSTWSAYQNYKKSNPGKPDPLIALLDEFVAELGDGATPETPVKVTWPTFLLMYRTEPETH